MRRSVGFWLGDVVRNNGARGRRSGGDSFFLSRHFEKQPTTRSLLCVARKREREKGRTYIGELYLPRHDDGKKARLLLGHLAALAFSLSFTTAPRSLIRSREGTLWFLVVGCDKPKAKK